MQNLVSGAKKWGFWQNFASTPRKGSEILLGFGKQIEKKSASTPRKGSVNLLGFGKQKDLNQIIRTEKAARPGAPSESQFKKGKAYPGAGHKACTFSLCKPSARTIRQRQAS